MKVCKRMLGIFLSLIMAVAAVVVASGDSGSVSLQFFGQNSSDYTWTTLCYGNMVLNQNVAVNNAVTADMLNDLDDTVKLGMQIKDESLAVGQSSTVEVSINNVVIKATGFEDVVIENLEYKTTLTAVSASWGVTGNSLDIYLDRYLDSDSVKHINAINSISANVLLKSYVQDTSSGDVEINKPTEPMPMSDITGLELVRDMKIGWNLGNSLDCKDKSYTTPEAHETYWSNPKTTKAMIDTVKSAGFNTIRVPVSWGEKMNSSNVVDSAWMDRVEEVVNYGLANDMYVIVNVHHDDSWIVPRETYKESAKIKLKALWTQIAQRFEYYDEHVIFEVLNEPRLVGDATEWTGGTAEARAIINEYNQTAIDAIRATGGNNERRFVMAPPHGAAMSALNGYTVPNDDNVIVSIHSYSPYEFAMNGYGTSSWGSDSDKIKLKAELQNLYNKFISKNIPVVIGEFGATNKANTSDRETWAEYYVATAREYGITCVLWDNNKFGTGTEMFGMLDRSNCTWTYPTVIEALMKGADNDVIYNPDDSGNTGDDIFNGIAVSSNWGQAVSMDITAISGMSSGDKIAVEYSADTEPELIIQKYDTNEWIKINPDMLEAGMAYYSYETIINSINGNLGNYDIAYVGDKGAELTVTRVYIVSENSYVTGDVNNDGTVDIFDAVKIAKYVIGGESLSEENISIADVNGDGEANIYDATAIAKTAIGA